MRVAHICNRFSVLTETFIYDYVTELERQGVDNHVLSLHAQENADTRPFPKVHVVERPNRWHPRRLWHRAMAEVRGLSPHTSSWPQQREFLQEAIVHVNPDAIHAHFGHIGVLASPVAEKLGVPLFTTFYGFDISRLAKQAFWRSEYAKLADSADAVTVLSEDMRAAVVKIGFPREHVHVVHLSRRLDDLAFVPPTGAGIRNFISVGRLVEKKGHFDTVRAFQNVLQEGYDVRLTIVGDGALRPALQAYVAENGMAEYVECLGARPNAEVLDLMRAADAFILCSKTAEDGDREGTPTVLVEAQALGLPCVSTYHAGIPEMIPEENHAFLAMEGNVDEIATCIARLVDAAPDAVHATAQRGRQMVEDEFELAQQVDKLKRLYLQFRTDEMT